MKEIIILFSLIIIVFLMLNQKKQEHFSSIKTLPHNPNISPKDTLEPKFDLNNMKNLYIIDSYHYSREYSKRIVLKIEDEKATDLKKIFSFRNSKDYKPEDITEKEKNNIIEKGSNLRIDNGIFIYEVPEKNNFKLTPLKYQQLTNKLYNGTKAVEDIKIIQYYNPEDEDNEIKYMIYYQNHLLYVDLVDQKNEIYEMKKLSIEEICENEGNNYEYIGNKDLKIPNDTNSSLDKEYNRDYNDIPINQMCPKSHPIACSDIIHWRNHCTNKGKDENTGICNEFDEDVPVSDADKITFKNEDNLPMRNFKCVGFKCHNKSIGRNLISEQPKQDNHCIEPLDFIETGNTLEQHKISNIPLTKFLFSINSFMCNIKSKKILDKNGNYIHETGFCHSHIPVEKKEISGEPSESEIKFYDTIEIKRNNEECPEGEIEIKKNINSNTNFSDNYKLCVNENKSKKEGITKIKIVNGSCNEVQDNEPSNWIEAENTSELIGCYGHNKYFNIEEYKEKIFNPDEDGKEACRNKALEQNIDYYAFDNGDCYTMNDIPLIPKFFNSDCIGENQEVTEGINSLNKIKIFKTKKENLEKMNIQENRIYEESYYKIKTDLYGLQYIFDDNKLKGEEANDLVTDLNTVRFERVNDIERNYEPLRYNEEIKIRFNVNNIDNKITLNRIKQNESIIISQIDFDSDQERKYIGINIGNPLKKDIRIKHTVKTRSMIWGYGLSYYDTSEVVNSKSEDETDKRKFCKYLIFPYQSIDDKYIDWYKDNRSLVGMIIGAVVLIVVSIVVSIVTFGGASAPLAAANASTLAAITAAINSGIAATAIVTTVGVVGMTVAQVAILITVATVIAVSGATAYSVYYQKEYSYDDRIKPRTEKTREKWKDNCGGDNTTHLYYEKFNDKFKILDFNQNENMEELKYCSGLASFPKPFNNYTGSFKSSKGEDKKPVNDYDFNIQLSILNSFTEKSNISERGGKYERYFRGYIPDINRFNTHFNLYHAQYKNYKLYNKYHYFKNLIKDRHQEDDAGYILPSKIQPYIKGTNDNSEEEILLFLEKYKLTDNYPFKLLDLEEEEEEEELTFYILNKKSLDDFVDGNQINRNETIGDYVDLNENLFLYNDKFGLLLSLNNQDQYNNSFILTNNLLVIDYNSKTEGIIDKINLFCQFNIEMVDKPEGKHNFNELKKVCYKKEPFKVNDIVKAKYQEEPCGPEEIDINMGESSNFHLCLDKEDMSEKRNHHFKEQKPTDSNGYIPFPLK